MLKFMNELPTDFPIAGVHCVPVFDNGNLMMVWDREEKVLTTIGGRLEENESVCQLVLEGNQFVYRIFSNSS